MIGLGSLLGLLVTLALYYALRQNLNSSLLDASARRQIDALLLQAFVPAGIFVVVLSGLVAGIISADLVEPLRDMRAQLRDLARGNQAQFVTSLLISEHAALGAAIETVIADLRGQNAEVEQQRRQLEDLLESGAEGLVRVNARGRIVHANRAAAALLGLPAHPQGQAFRALVRQHELRTLVEETLAGRTADPVDITVDDRQLLAASRALPDGEAVLVVMDMTQLKRLETVRRDFVANVSHELKTPLTSIRGYAETLLSDDVSPETRVQFLEVIHKHAERVHRLVDDLLDLSRLQSGGWQPRIQPVDAVQVANDAWSTLLEQQRREFTIDADPGIKVSADPEGLRQVFTNLFENSIRHTTDGGHVAVSVYANRASRARASVEIKIADNGAGIPRDDLPRVFERFYRVNAARSRGDGGTGLGLSIVKHLVERMNGQVAMESELGKGTAVRVTLPTA
jgi:two-component system, OmpR family, phosphate regulon sensor histidine kinase PhoR